MGVLDNIEYFFYGNGLIITFCLLLVTLGFALSKLYQFDKIIERQDDRMRSIRQKDKQIFSNIKHELRTPLSVIIGHLDLLKEWAAEKGFLKKHEEIQIMMRSGRYLMDLLTSLSDFHGEVTEDISIEKESIEVVAFFSSSIDLVTNKELMNGNEINLTVDKSVPKYLILHQMMVKKIIVNIVDNALKFTRNSKVSVNVRCVSKPSSEDPELIFSVKDFGKGIRKEESKKVFQAFFQVESSMSKSYGGLGLGLTICDFLVKKMGGKIEVSSSYGNGSEFKVYIPLGYEIKGVDSYDVDVTRSWSSSKQKKLNVKKIKRAKVLIVDDAEEIILLYKNLLHSLDMEFIFATNGKEALDIVREHSSKGAPIDLIFMDLQMPILNGYQVTRMLRKQGFSTPIVAVTAHETTGNKRVKVEYGFTEILSKPVFRDVLVENIQYYIEGAGKKGA